MSHQPPRPGSAVPWFRYRIVWLAVALPAAAVIGCAVTAVIAVRHRDVPIVDHGAEHALRAEDAAEGSDRARSMLPAELGRNHATTPLR